MADNFDNCQIEYDVDIAPRTSFKIGGKAKRLISPDSKESFAKAIAKLSKSGEKFIVLGAGSNVLFSSSGFDGTVVLTKNLNHVQIDGDVICAECGVGLTALAVNAKNADLSGIEFAYGIPGFVGGGLFMNAGAYGGCLSDVIVFAEVCDENGNIFTVSKEDMALSYRESIFQHKPLFILCASFKLKKCDNNEEIKALMDDLMSKRKEKQPLDLPSAGSTFKRGNGFITAQIIDECGLKGLCVGDAQVSKKHAGFIVNLGKATSDDVLSLIEKVKAEVYRKTSKNIECEIRIIK